MFSFLKKKKKEIKAVCSGTVLSITESSDETFASCMLGNGVMIRPTDTGVVDILAPCSGEITAFMEDSGHAVGIRTEYGLELMIHIGVDTVQMNGEGFTGFISQGKQIKEGEKLVSFDRDMVEGKGYCCDVMMIMLNGNNFPNSVYNTGMEAVAGQTVVAEL